MLTHVKGALSAGALERLITARVGIAGAGGLGSNCAMHLVRMGVKHLVVVDDDVVERSNLNRQFFFERQVGQSKVDALKENLCAITSGLSLDFYGETVIQDNVDTFFGACDAVVEAFDAVASKKLLTEYCLKKKIFLVSASGISGWGESDRFKNREIFKDFFVVGDGETEVSAASPALSSGVGIAAAKQADLIFTFLAGKMPKGA
ncbi:MAG: sulfur carrier protein ThiS adenylyltransferase ThiF [Desulfobacterales bacterium]|nr:sulfur carrier protein ThiS adenylyltransferase ThiF [Desulfobacterales bacterium]